VECRAGAAELAVDEFVGADADGIAGVGVDSSPVFSVQKKRRGGGHGMHRARDVPHIKKDAASVG
jgi:hypothetical protein